MWTALAVGGTFLIAGLIVLLYSLRVVSARADRAMQRHMEDAKRDASE